MLSASSAMKKAGAWQSCAATRGGPPLQAAQLCKCIGLLNACVDLWQATTSPQQHTPAAQLLECLGTSSRFTARAAGKKSHNRQFEDYGDSYGQNDVVGCLLDCDSHSISYYKNGAPLGVAFQVHICSEHVIGSKLSHLAHGMHCDCAIWW